ncbi:hypothetical protein SLE2022_064510 [Rubroshorea leprosula]
MQHFFSPFLFTCMLFIRFSRAAADCSIGNGRSLFEDATVVDKSGLGNFNTIQAAIDSIPQNNNFWIKLEIKPGIYEEQVTIPKNKPCIFLQGQGRDVTTITFDAHRKTDTSPAFTLFADNTIVNGITFKNSFKYPLGLVGFIRDKGKGSNTLTQAVAARVHGDKSAFYNCGFLGLQETLWDAEGRHYFHNCYIQRGIDFIFGSGQSSYEDCVIYASAGSYSSVVSRGFITAQGRLPRADPSSFVFRGGTISGDLQVYLGRAYNLYSRVIFSNTTMDANVICQGWDSWSYPGQEVNFTYLGFSEIKFFLTSSFVNTDGWLP